MTDLSRHLDGVRQELDDLAERLRAATSQEPALGLVHPAHRESAENLVHYVSLRRDDIRGLQLGRRGPR